jgi:hypothetical protein
MAPPPCNVVEGGAQHTFTFEAFGRRAGSRPSSSTTSVTSALASKEPSVTPGQRRWSLASSATGPAPPPGQLRHRARRSDPAMAGGSGARPPGGWGRHALGEESFEQVLSGVHTEEAGDRDPAIGHDDLLSGPGAVDRLASCLQSSPTVDHG